MNLQQQAQQQAQQEQTGFVALVGLTNSGKSTLFNHLLRQKLAITSKKSQTTRVNLRGILTHENCQMILVDTPGLHHPQKELQRAMLLCTRQAVRECDLIVYLSSSAEETATEETDFLTKLRHYTQPKLLVLTKTDLPHHKNFANKTTNLQSLGDFSQHIAISVRSSQGIDTLLEWIKNHLPESPFLYPKEQVTEQNLRFFTAEFIREVVIEKCHQEIPYGVAIAIQSFQEKQKINVIQATIFVEKQGHIPILLGRNGLRIKAIGEKARRTLEPFFEKKIFLGLQVKLKKNWTNNPKALQEFGLPLIKKNR